MKHIKDFQKFNEGWKEIALAGALSAAPIQKSFSETPTDTRKEIILGDKRINNLNTTIGFLRETGIEEDGEIPKSIIKKLIDMRDGKEIDDNDPDLEVIRSSMKNIEYNKRRAKQDINMSHQLERWESIGKMTDYKLEGDEIVFIMKKPQTSTFKRSKEDLF